MHAFPSIDRRRTGAYFTPAPLVDWVLGRVAEHVPAGAPLALIDPACGAGAFLAGAAKALPQASLHGLELDPQIAAATARRVCAANLHAGNALDGGLEPLLRALPTDAVELWVGNPPYNGTSPLLRTPAAYARARALLPPRFRLPSGTSLRDDFAFFLLLAAARLSQQTAGVLAFLTPSTLLDAYLYAPVREALLDALELREVTDLGPGQFRHARVRTCLTVWTTRTGRRRRRAPGFRDALGVMPAALTPPEPLSPRAPDFLLRPTSAEAEALDAEWRACGEELTCLVPVSFPGLKTRFDELLVDADPRRLLARVSEFLETSEAGLAAFAARHHIAAKHLPKLTALKRHVPEGTVAIAERVRPFIRYAGARHRSVVPDEAWAHCYLDRALIPRGDHRLRLLPAGRLYDPHAVDVKLLFNVRERPLSASRVDRSGCVHAHRHSRFAPLFVPRSLRDGSGELDPEDLVPNLSPAGLALASSFGGPAGLFDAICRFINSEPVQDVWAPALGSHRILPVPLQGEALERRGR